MADLLSSHKMVCEQCEMPMSEATTNYDDNKCEDADKQQKEEQQSHCPLASCFIINIYSPRKS